MTQEQLLQQQQLLQERQEFEAWRASRAQANLQPQPQMTSAGPVQTETNVNISQRSASVARVRPEDQTTIKAKAKRARSASTSCRSPSPKRDYPRGTCTATRPSQASPKKAEHTLTPAQDLEAFKADMTSMLSDMLQASLSKFPPLLQQTPWEIRSPQDPQEILGMREQITLMLQKNAIVEVPPDSPGFYSNVFLVRKSTGGWRPVIDLKNLERPHSCTSFPYVHDKLC